LKKRSSPYAEPDRSGVWTQNLTGTKHKTLCDALGEIEMKITKLKTGA
jgi:hypothetical protein